LIHDEVKGFIRLTGCLRGNIFIAAVYKRRTLGKREKIGMEKFGGKEKGSQSAERNIGRELTIVIAVVGLGVLAMAMLQPVLPLYLTSLGVNPKILGFMFSTAMVGMVLGESGWGWAADKVGVRLPLGVGTIVSALVVICFAFPRNTVFLFTIFFFWGLFRSALFGPVRGFVGAAAPPAKKATFMAIIAVMLSASRSVGALPSGFLADSWGYRAVIYTSCGIALLGGLILLMGLRKKRRQITSPSSSGPPLTAVRARIPISLYRPLAPQCVVAFFQYLGLGAYVTFLPLLATQVVGVSVAKVGVLFTLGGLVAVILGIPMGVMADRMGKKITMALGLLISAAAMPGMAYAGNFIWLTGFVILRSIGMVAYSPAALGLLSESIPPKRQSTVMGLYGGVCENSGVILGSALGGLVWSQIGPRAAFLMGGLASLLGTVVCLLFVTAKISMDNHLSVDSGSGCCE